MLNLDFVNKYLAVIGKAKNIENLNIESAEVESVKIVVTDYYHPDYDCVNVSVTNVVINGEELDDLEEVFSEADEDLYEFEEDNNFSRSDGTSKEDHLSSEILNHPKIVTKKRISDDN